MWYANWKSMQTHCGASLCLNANVTANTASRSIHIVIGENENVNTTELNKNCDVPSQIGSIKRHPPFTFFTFAYRIPHVWNLSFSYVFV